MKRYAVHENIIFECLQVILLISAHRFGARNICKAKMLRVLADLTGKYPANYKAVLWIMWGVLAYKENQKDAMREHIGVWIYNLADTAQVLLRISIYG